MTFDPATLRCLPPALWTSMPPTAPQDSATIPAKLDYDRRMYQVQAGARMGAIATPSVPLCTNSLYAPFKWRPPEIRLTSYGISGTPTRSSRGSIVYPDLDLVYASMRRGRDLQTAKIAGRRLCLPFAALFFIGKMKSADTSSRSGADRSQ